MYEVFKNELAKRCSSTKYFTKEFFETFMKERHDAAEDFACEKEHYTITKNSDFYNLNGGAYCEMLSIAAELCDDKYKIEFAPNGHAISTTTIYAENRDQARRKAEFLAEKYGLHVCSVTRK